MSSQPGSHTADADIPNKAQQEAPQGKKENMADVRARSQLTKEWTNTHQARAPGHIAGVEGKSVRSHSKISLSSNTDFVYRPTTLPQTQTLRQPGAMRKMEARPLLSLRRSRRNYLRVLNALCRMQFTILAASSPSCLQ